VKYGTHPHSNFSRTGTGSGRFSNVPVYWKGKGIILNHRISVGSPVQIPEVSEKLWSHSRHSISIRHYSFFFSTPHFIFSFLSSTFMNSLVFLSKLNNSISQRFAISIDHYLCMHFQISPCRSIKINCRCSQGSKISSNLAIWHVFVVVRLPGPPRARRPILGGHQEYFVEISTTDAAVRPTAHFLTH